MGKGSNGQGYTLLSDGTFTNVADVLPSVPTTSLSGKPLVTASAGYAYNGTLFVPNKADANGYLQVALGGVTIDPFKGALKTIDVVHEEVHEGKHYIATHYLSSISSGVSFNVLIQVPAAKFPHFLFSSTVKADSLFLIYETTTFSAAGTSIPIFNNSRSSSNTSGLTITHTPTITADGTQIFTKYSAAGNAGNGGGGGGGNSTEFILKASTNYIFRLTSLSNGNIASFEFDWYE